MKKLISVIVVFASVIIGVSQVSAQQNRVDLSKSGPSWFKGNENTNLFPELQPEDVSADVNAASPMRKQGPMKIGPTGSTIVGWRSFNEPKGWFELATDGTETMLWQNSELEPAGGFIKDGKLYSYYAKIFLGEMYVSYFINDLATGETLETGSLKSTDASQFVLICTYDSAQDLVYAYTYNEDASANWIQTIDPDTREFTKLCEPTVAPRLICYSPVDGKIYGISKTGEFVRLNPETGDLEVIGNTGFTPSKYKQTMTYSPVDKKFIWAALMEDLSACVIAVDPTTGEGEKVGDLPLWTEYNILTTMDEMQDEQMPAAPEILSVDFDKASLSGSVSVKMPQKTFGDTELAEDAELTLVAYEDAVEHSRQTAAKGSTLTIDFEDLSQGNHTFSFEVIMSMSDGQTKISPQVSATRYVGYDVPVAPENVILETSRVSWDAVTEGVNDGYLDAENVTYDVYINAVKQNVSPITECFYAIELPEGEMTSYWADVVATCHELSSEKGTSNKILYGDAFEIPVSFLPEPDELDLFSIRDANGDGITWLYDYNRYAYTYRYTQSSADDWLFLPIMNFKDTEVYYEFALEAWAFNKNYPESFELAYGKSQEPSAMTVLASYEEVRNTDPKIYSVRFKVPEAGAYYLAVHVNSKAMQYDFFVRNMSVSVSTVTDESPAAFSNMTVAAADKGELKALVGCTMPVNNLAGEPLAVDKELKLVVASSVSSVEKIAKPGEQIAELAVETIQGTNEIAVSLYDGDAKVYEEKVNVYTGLAAPAAVSNIKVTMSDDNLVAHVTWDAPKYGSTEGYFDVSTVKYYYYDYIWGTGWENMSEIGKDCEFELALDPGTPLQVKYIAVKAVNEIGESPSLPYSTVVVGEPHEAPMTETFANGEYAYNPILVLTPDTYHNAGCALGDSSIYLADCKSADGYAVISYTKDLYYDSFGLLSLPKFTTIGLEEPVLSLSAWIGDATAKTEVYAEANGVASTLVGAFEPESINDWQDIEITLPEEFLGKGWVEVKLKSYYHKAMAYSIIDGYKMYDRSLGSVNSVATDVCVYSENGAVVVKGADGKMLEIYNIDGSLVTRRYISSNMERVNVNSGIYIIRIEDYVVKLIN